AGNIMQPTADAGGTTSAYAGDGTSVWASKLELDADGDVRAESHTLAISIGAASVNVVEAQAFVTNVTEAFAGKDKDSASTTAGVVDVRTAAGARGTLDMNATSHSEAVAAADGAAVGGITVSSMQPVARIQGSTSAYVGPYSKVVADTVTADAVEDTVHARADTFAGSFGLGTVSILVANAE